MNTGTLAAFAPERSFFGVMDLAVFSIFFQLGALVTSMKTAQSH